MWRSILILTAIALSLLVFTSCETPVKTVPYTDDQGNEFLAYDADEDGQPDLNEAGQVLVIPLSEHAKYADMTDNVIPGLLTTIGLSAGIPILGVIGAFWQKWKLGRSAMNIIATIQAGRQRLKDGGFDEALNVIDETLGEQTKETTKFVRDVKDKIGLLSVSKSTPVNKPAA